MTRDVEQAIKEFNEAVEAGFLWIDHNTNELCMDKPDHSNITYLPDYRQSFQN